VLLYTLQQFPDRRMEKRGRESERAFPPHSLSSPDPPMVHVRETRGDARKRVEREGSEVARHGRARLLWCGASSRSGRRGVWLLRWRRPPSARGRPARLQISNSHGVGRPRGQKDAHEGSARKAAPCRCIRRNSTFSLPAASPRSRRPHNRLLHQRLGMTLRKGWTGGGGLVLLLRVGKSTSSRRGRSTSRYKEAEGWAGATATRRQRQQHGRDFFTGDDSRSH
jgi:hypothetical protein